MVKSIVLSRDLPLREVVIAWALINFGGDKFPCVPEPEIIIDFSGKIRKGADVFFANNGTGESVLDNIASGNAILKKLLFYIGQDRPPLGIGHGISHLRELFPDNAKRAVDWAFDCLLIRYNEQKKRMELAQRIGCELQAERAITGPENQKCRVAMIKADSGIMRDHWTMLKADIIICIDSAGYVQILAKDESLLEFLDEIIKILRIDENFAKGDARVKIDYNTISNPGILRSIPEWQYDKSSCIIRNVVAPTRIQMDQFMRIAHLAINDSAFDYRFIRKCIRGLCTTSPYKPCFLFRYSLSRCVIRRHQMDGRSIE